MEIKEIAMKCHANKVLLAGAVLGCYGILAQAEDVEVIVESAIPPDPKTFLTLLENAVVEDATTATAYYQAIDPLNKKDTYAKWLAETGFISDPLDYTDTGTIAFSSDVITVLHHNKVDLDFTRLFSIRCEPDCNSPNPDIYSTIENFPSFADAKNRINRLAAVTMEWTSAADGTSPGSKFATFYAFTGDGNRNVIDPNTLAHVPFAPDLDGDGNKQIPGLCNSCHGGIPDDLNVDGSYPRAGDTNALFIPLDLDNFFFDDAPGNTQVDQEANYKEINEIVLITHQTSKMKDDEAAGIKRFPAGKDLIEGWYGGPGMPNDTFNGEYVPQGWKVPHAPAGAEELYLEAVAPACRACHVQRKMELDFGSYENFMVFEDAHKELVLRHECGKDNDTAARSRRQDDQGVMPLAKVTYRRFWGLETNGDPVKQADIFKEHVGVFECEN
jgi:hypothetical protein